MSAILTPGECLTIVTALKKHSKARRFVADLPRQSVADLHALLNSVRWFMDCDPHIGAMLEGAMNRLDQAVDFGALGRVQAADLKTVVNFLRVVPTTVRQRA